MFATKLYAIYDLNFVRVWILFPEYDEWYNIFSLKYAIKLNSEDLNMYVKQGFSLCQVLHMEPGAAGAPGPHVCLEQRHENGNAVTPRQKMVACLVKEAVIRRNIAKI